ncbi:uncharacterized protein [Prorops nasuta]|uniref:uncharacterized protein n=1 Tax=Prorops nasuta TaxID=863751 RepID=UPI0034CE63EF
MPIRTYDQLPKIMRGSNKDRYPSLHINSSFSHDYITKVNELSTENNKNYTFKNSINKVPNYTTNENEVLKDKKDSNTSEDLQKESSVFISKTISNVTFDRKLLLQKEKVFDTDFLEYMPIDIMQHVHSILKSQSMTIEGKIEFLKSFEHMVSKEIETQLQISMSPHRRKRGGEHYYDHGYEEHEESGLGFPSIEGALMAISFLTFAVYLVRLVMLLFRNISNVPPPTNGSTFFYGKRKRSLDDFNDDTARILNSVDNFMTNIQ